MRSVSMDGGLSQNVVHRRKAKAAGQDANVDPAWRARRLFTHVVVLEDQETDVMPLNLVVMGWVVNLESTGKLSDL